MKRAILGALALTALGGAYGEAQGPIYSAFEQCKAALADKRLDVLRGKIPTLAEYDVTDAMLSDRTKANQAEAKALRLYFDKVMECDKSLDAAFNDGKPTRLIDVTPEQHARNAFILYLMHGLVSFGDYAAFALVDRSRTEKLAADLQARRKAETETLVLSCVNEASDKLAGVELQYVIDMGSNSVHANRGPAKPSDVYISPLEITFRQEDIRVTISRTAGTFTIRAPETGIFAHGRCQRVERPRF